MTRDEGIDLPPLLLMVIEGKRVSLVSSERPHVFLPTGKKDVICIPAIGRGRKMLVVRKDPNDGPSLRDFRFR